MNYFNTEQVKILRDPKAIVEFEVEKMKKLLLSGCVPMEELSLRKKKDIKLYLIEFSVYYRSANNKKAVSTLSRNGGSERIYSQTLFFGQEV